MLSRPRFYTSQWVLQVSLRGLQQVGKSEGGTPHSIPSGLWEFHWSFFSCQTSRRHFFEWLVAFYPNF